jgi:hypothetical protein
MSAYKDSRYFEKLNITINGGNPPIARVHEISIL